MYASPALRAMPMTSPVDFISGPRMMSDPGKRENGRTGCFTVTKEGFASPGPRSASFSPQIRKTAIFASGTPMDLLTKGTVRLERGLTSIT